MDFPMSGGLHNHKVATVFFMQAFITVIRSESKPSINGAILVRVEVTIHAP
jgi:hypothetical protein